MSLRIAIIGTRGIPNNYGGFEQISGYLSKGLVERGHSVTVYNSHRHPYKEKSWNGVDIVHCFDPEFLIGTAGQFIYDLNCIMNARKKNFDIILLLGYTSSSVWGRLYPKRSIVINNMDGLEWKRAKYSNAVKKFLLYAEKLAIKWSDFYVADSIEIKKYLDEKYNVSSKYIAYGAEVIDERNEEVLKQYDVTGKDYFLLMARSEPENNIEVVLDGFCKSFSQKKFIVICHTKNKYGKYILNKYKDEKRIVFAGHLYNNVDVRTLISSSLLYFHGHSVGGTNPSLLEAMAGKTLIAAHNNPFNKSVLDEDALFFTNRDDVKNIIEKVKAGDEEQMMIENNFSKINTQFSWQKIVDEYEQFFYECIGVQAVSSELRAASL